VENSTTGMTVVKLKLNNILRRRESGEGVEGLRVMRVIQEALSRATYIGSHEIKRWFPGVNERSDPHNVTSSSLDCFVPRQRPISMIAVDDGRVSGNPVALCSITRRSMVGQTK
jgi:hypothetical protein